jgi:hypothetical protein
MKTWDLLQGFKKKEVFSCLREVSSGQIGVGVRGWTLKLGKMDDLVVNLKNKRNEGNITL